MAPVPFDPLPRAVLFDLDDTLCDYSSARDTRLRHAFNLHAGGNERGWSDAELDSMVAESILMHPHGTDHFGELFRQAGVLDPRVAEAAARWYRNNRLHGLAYFPRAVAVLHSVRSTRGQDGVERPIGIITNGPADVQRAKSKFLNVDSYVDFTLISGEFGVSKPDPSIFAEALRRAGVNAHEAVFVGDSPEFDIAGAHGVGMPSVWLNARGVDWPMSDFAPDRIIRDISELPGLIGSSEIGVLNPVPSR